MKSKQKKEQEPVEKREISSSVPSSCVSSLEQERLLDILDNIPLAVVGLEKHDGRLTFANKRAIELCGVNPSGVTLEEYDESSKIHKLDGSICTTKELCSCRALFNGETVLNSPENIYRHD